jgi:single-strand DNA-binding protein
MNCVFLAGNLGRDPELRETNKGTSVVNLSVATSEYRKNEDGEGTRHTEWHKVTVFGKAAEFVDKFFSTGSGIVVRGKLQTSSYEDKSGVTKYSTEIIADNVEFAPGGKKEEKDENEYE